MTNNLKDSILLLLKESQQFNSNDVLVNADFSSSRLVEILSNLEFKTSEFPSNLLKEADKSVKESGVNPLCLAMGSVQLELNHKVANAPILLAPISYFVNKVKGTIAFSAQEDEIFINPFLEAYLNDLDIDISNIFSLEDRNVAKSVSADIHFSELLGKIQPILTDNGLKANYAIRMIGNFHHHRYQIIRELEELLSAENHPNHLATLFGFSKETYTTRIELPPDNLFSSDTNHEEVIERIKENNLVIQGPPGTGKSQVLSNAVAKILAAGKTSIFVSEKRAALEVIQKKLSAFQLDKLCFIATSDKLSHSFLHELKSTWDYFEQFKRVPANNLRLSEQYNDNLQMALDLLGQKELIGGVSFHHFQEMSAHLNLENFSYNGEAPSISKFIELETIIQEVYAEKFSKILGQIRQRTIQNDDFLKLDCRISEWLFALEQLSEVVDLEIWYDFGNAVKQAVQCQIYENDIYKKHSEIFQTKSRAQKSFLILRKKYLQVKIEIDHINADRSHWKITPSESETKSLLNLLKKGSFFARRKAYKRWRDISQLPFEDAKTELEKHLSEIEKINSFSQIIIKFCELGIDDPETEINLIFQTLGLFTEDQWNTLASIPEEKRSKFTQSHSVLNNLYHDLKSNFNLHGNTSIKDYLDALNAGLPKIISQRGKYQLLDDECLRCLFRNASLTDFEGEVLNSSWVRFKERFPAFSKFSVRDLHEKVSLILQAENQEAQLFAQTIENRQQATFTHYHYLLNTPARKLREEEKILKSRLRKGKSILVKEFSKTRNHPSLRELYNSEAREWIQLLKPIWLSNPTQLAKCFPMETGLFDVGIFDEASQIPIQNALGALQRCSRAVVAGDDQQMGPSTYFKTGTSEEMDLLHQANYYWPKVALSHHYRSAHPDLITFSNTHFYNDQLQTFPSYNASIPIKHHFVENGVFSNRKNIPEALQVAAELEKALTESKTIGVVAFSEEQLTCIWENLSQKSQTEISRRLEANQGFFKALENVQGDECEHLFISFAYAKNETGEFHMRFGPMNTSNGRKRLNVLLTRAIETIDFFCSVRSSDFKLSDNESLNLLRQWISFTEIYTPNHALIFPFGLNPEVNGNELTFHRIHETLPRAKEIVTLQYVLESRGWTVRYT